MKVIIFDNSMYMFNVYEDIISIKYTNQKNINPLSNVKHGDYLILISKQGGKFVFHKNEIASLEIVQD